MADYIPLFLDWLECTDGLTAVEKGRLVDAMVLYALGETWQDRIVGNEKFVFNVIRGQIDRHMQRSEDAKTYGKLGGRPKKGSETLGFSKKPNNSNSNSNTKSKSNSDTKSNSDSDIEADASCAERRGARRSAPAETPEPTPSEFEILLNDGTTYNVPMENIAVYHTLYPAVDIEQELRNMMGWCIHNEKHRKTRGGIKRFIGSWLQREQDKAKKVSVQSYGKPDLTQADPRIAALEDLKRKFAEEEGDSL